MVYCTVSRVECHATAAVPSASVALADPQGAKHSPCLSLQLAEQQCCSRHCYRPQVALVPLLWLPMLSLLQPPPLACCYGWRCIVSPGRGEGLDVQAETQCGQLACWIPGRHSNEVVHVWKGR